MAGSLILGIESSGPRSAVALTRDDELLVEVARAGTSHNEVLLGLVDEALTAARAGLDDLAGIGVTSGPGMFTSLRVGLATAAGLALPRGLALKAVGTLPALAATCAPARLVLAILDARRGQVYYGLYDDSACLAGPAAVEPAALPGLLPGSSGFVLGGSGVQLCLPHLAGFDPADSGIRHPSACAVALLARRLLERDGPDEPGDLAPRYLRRTDAELNREKNAGRA